MKVPILGKNGPKIVNLNRRKAIREKCLTCSCWILKDVDNCEFINCPLYSFRSGKGKQNTKARARAVREYCLLWCMNGQHVEVVKCVSKDCPLFPYRLTKVDRSAEVQISKNLPKIDHIERLSEAKIKYECKDSRLGVNAQKDRYGL